MSGAKKIFYIFLILIIPVMVSVFTFKTQSDRERKRVSSGRLDRLYKDIAGLSYYELTDADARAIIEVDAARLSVGISTTDMNRGLRAAQEVRQILGRSEYETDVSKRRGIAYRFHYMMGKSNAQMGLMSSRMTAQIGLLSQAIGKNLESSYILLRIPKYASVSFSNSKLVPVYTKGKYNWYRLDNASVKGDVTVSADLDSVRNRTWEISALIALLLGILGNVFGAFQLGVTNSPPVSRKGIMDMCSTAPAYLGGVALLVLAIVGFFANHGDIYTDLWVNSPWPLPEYNSLIPGVALNLFLVIIAVQGIIGNAYYKELVLFDESMPNNEKFRNILQSEFIYLRAWLMSGALEMIIDITGLSTLRLMLMPFFLYAIFLNLLNRKYITYLRVRLDQVDMQWLSRLKNILVRFSSIPDKKSRIELDLSEDGMKSAYIAAQYFGPLIVTGKAGSRFSTNELEFLMLDKLLLPIKRIAGFWHLMIFVFTSMTVVYVVTSLLNAHLPLLIAIYLSMFAFGIPIIVSLFQLPAVLGTPFPTVGRYRRVLGMTGDYGAARAALVKYTGRTKYGKLKKSWLSRILLKYKLRVLSEARDAGTVDLVSCH